MESAAQPVLRVRGLSAQLEGWPLFESIDLEVSAGECVVLEDENDLVRTALLECVVGERAPSSGTVQRPDCYAVWHDEGFPADRAIAAVIDDWLEAAGVTGLDATSVLGGVGLGHRAGHEGWAMSAGERRRVALAVAAAVRPPLLVLDEPERGLDPPAIRWLVELIRQQLGAGVAVLVATFHPAVADLADRTLTVSSDS